MGQTFKQIDNNNKKIPKTTPTVMFGIGEMTKTLWNK